VHGAGKIIEDPADEDWYQFELLKADDVQFDVTFNPALGTLSFDLLQIVAGVPVVRGSSTATTAGATLTASNLTAGRYYLQVKVAGNTKTHTYGFGISPASTSSTRVFYVNDSSTTNDAYTLGVGNAANTGLTPNSPKASIQQILDSYSLGATDLVKIDTGTYATSVLATASDEAATYVGTPGGSRLNGTFEMADSDYNTLYRLTFGASGTPIYIRGTAADPTTNTTLKQIKILASSTGIRIDGGVDHALIDSEISGAGSYGVYMPSGGSISITGTDISGRSIGGYFGSLASANLVGNDVSATTYGFFFTESSNLTVSNNDLHDAQYGIYRSSGGSMLVSGNRLFNNQVGAYSNVSNTTYRGNTITSNGTGLLGHGVFGGPDWDVANANVIQNNNIGVRPAAGQTVSFNRILNNQIGIQPEGSAALRNNLLVGNATGVLIGAVSSVSLVNNTIVTSSGTGVRLQQSSSNVSLRNN
ncbi:MAG: right-handed parallel beta-helix repeat-containing protein, partial [Bacteroidota bacterium]